MKHFAYYHLIKKGGERTIFTFLRKKFSKRLQIKKKAVPLQP